MLLGLIGQPLLLQFHADDDVQVFGLLRGFLVPYPIDIKPWVIGIFHIVACMMTVEIHVDTAVYEVGIQLIYHIELALQVYHRAGLTLLIN